MKKLPLASVRVLAVAAVSMTCLLGSSCGTSSRLSSDPQGFSQGAQQEVKKGMTKDQVTAILGGPQSVKTHNSIETWIYSKRNVWKLMAPYRLAGDEVTRVVVTFNRSGRVSSVDTGGSSSRVF